MGNRYTHLQAEDRVLIYELLYSGWAIAEIFCYQKINDGWSPEIIDGYLRKKHKKQVI